MPTIPGKVRVIRGYQREMALDGVGTTGEPERSLGGHVDEVRAEGVEEPAHLTRRGNGEPYRRIRGKRQRSHAMLCWAASLGPGIVGSDDGDRGSVIHEDARDPPNHGGDPIDLGIVGIRYERNPHGWKR
jgi:hypothetical protein